MAEKRSGKRWPRIPTPFPSLYVSMVRAGESSGQLATVLNWLAEYQEKEQSRRMQIRSALAYPALLAIAGSVAIFLLIVLVVPKFAAMFTEFNQALPLPTVMLLTTASFPRALGMGDAWSARCSSASFLNGMRRRHPGNCAWMAGGCAFAVIQQAVGALGHVALRAHHRHLAAGWGAVAGCAGGGARCDGQRSAGAGHGSARARGCAKANVSPNACSRPGCFPAFSRI